MKLKIATALMGIALVLAIVLSSIYSTNATERVESFKIVNTSLKEDVLKKDFAYTACKAEIDNLEETIKGQEELILELQVKEVVLENYKSIMDYSVTYIYYLQYLMDEKNIIYPEFIVESVLEDDYYTEIE